MLFIFLGKLKFLIKYFFHYLGDHLPTQLVVKHFIWLLLDYIEFIPMNQNRNMVLSHLLTKTETNMNFKGGHNTECLNQC